MAEPEVIPHPNTIRGPIEETYNALREGIEAQFIEDRQALEATRRSDLVDNAAAKSAALVAAGLNPDGTTPSTYPETGDPENTVAPTVTGTAQIDEVLTAHNGTWTFSPSFAYLWERADTDETHNVAIDGATSSTYTLGEDDVGKIVRVQVTGTNALGHHVAHSAYTDEVLQAAPVNTDLPTVTGTARIGEVLTGTDGTWTGEDTIVRQWERANPDGSGAADIAGEQDTTYTLAEADVGKKVRLIVSATNDGGTTTVESTYTSTVLPLAPENTVVPTITGTEQVGQVLTAHDGTWSGDPDFTYQWERADSDESNNADINGATNSTYTLVQADEGKKIRVEVTGTNDGGNDSAESSYTGAIIAA